MIRQRISKTDRLVAGRSGRSLRNVHFLPGFVGVEKGHLGDDTFRRHTQVLLIDDPVVVDDEGHDPRGTVRGRICDHGEAADHLAVHHVAVCPSRRVLPLPLQDLVEIALVGDRLVAGLFATVAFSDRLGCQRTQGAFLLPLLAGRRPAEKIDPGQCL